MNFDLFVPYSEFEGVPSESTVLTVNRMVAYGWNGVVLTVTSDTAKKIPLPPKPIVLSQKSQAIIAQNSSLKVLRDYPAFPQFTRFNLETDDKKQVTLLGQQVDSLKYDVISITPLNEEVYKAAILQSPANIISFDVNKFVPRQSIKDLKAAINKNIWIEVRYSQFATPDQMERQRFLTACSSMLHVTRYKNLLYSYGELSHDNVRTPRDIMVIASLLGMKYPEKVPGEYPSSVLSRAISRRTHAGIVRKLDVPQTVVE